MLHCAAMPTEPEEPRGGVDAPRLQLWFEQFRDLAFIELALAGGVITLLGTVFDEAPNRGRGFIAIILLGLAAILALVAQAHVVDLSDAGKSPDKYLKWLRNFSMLLLGAGTGAFVMFVLRAYGLR